MLRVIDIKRLLYSQVPVPRFAVGIVIGRNGEMIKKIQNDTGVKIQFKPGSSRFFCWCYMYRCDVV